MATPYGHIAAFHPESESIKTYLERVQLYFAANKVPEDVQVPALLSAIGAPTYSLLSDLFAPDAPGSKSLQVISEALRRHFEPKRVVIAQRFHFHKREQATGESIADYDASLRKLASQCKFGDSLEEALRDRFVCGLRHEAIQRRLLSEVDLSYAKAMEIASAMEAADRDTKSLKGSEAILGKLQGLTGKGKDSQACYRCNRAGHSASTCKFKEASCHACGKKGHIAPACRSKSKNSSKPPQQGHGKQHRAHQLSATETPTEEDSSGDEYYLHKLGEKSSHPIKVSLLANGQSLEMEVDTGADISIISEDTRKTLFPAQKVYKSDLILKTYTGEPIRIIGQLRVRVQYGDQFAKLILVVVEGSGPSLLGRNWLKYLRLDWSRIAQVHATRLTTLNLVLDQHKAIFEEGLGSIEPYRATLQVNPDATPKFHKPRPVPLAIKGAIGQELDRMEREGIVERVDHSDWAAPIVAVPKKDGSFRICGDYKVTINQALAVDQYPLPKPEDLFASLTGGKVFTKLDLFQAYLQLQLDEESSTYVTINTHQGLYNFKRLPFGVASAPAMFQKLMDTILQGLSGVMCYIDDILISTSDERSHLDVLGEVLTRLEKHGLRLKREKCQFLMSSVEYLGHQVDASGIRPMPDKIDAVINAPPPKNVSELRSFLGLVNYYGKFVPNLSTLLHPLNHLLKVDVKWKWTPSCSQAFSHAKSELASARVLTHYDPQLPLNMAADASAYGVGAVLSHTFPDGSERPVAFASRSLTPSESNYAQIEKEALAIIFGMKKFHQYLYGRQFNLITDHKPLTAIFGPKKGVPSLAAARLQRWALLLSAYKYDISYKPSLEHANADGLSRLPLPTSGSQSDDVAHLFNIGQIQSLPVTVEDVKNATRSDRVLSKVYRYARNGWPGSVPADLQSFKSKQDEIGLEGGCLMWGIRVIIPAKLQSAVLQSLHMGHPGITRMKAIARSYFWWNGLDKDIEKLANLCESCQAVKSSPAVAPLHPWVWPDAPWKRLHVDFAGPFLGRTFLIVVDAHSKWPEVITMSSTTSQSTIEVMRSLFSRYGLPEQLVSDNGTQFTSEEFTQFMKRNGVKHIRSAPYHPASNGLAERFVQTFKRAMKASEGEGKTLNQRLSQFLFSYRASPQATTNTSPSELFLGRALRTRLDLLRPNCQSRVVSKQADQKLHHDWRSRPRRFTQGQAVMVRDFRPHTSKWMKGVVIQQLGPVTYTVEVEGKLLKRHVDHLRQWSGSASSTSVNDHTIQDNFTYSESYPDEPQETSGENEGLEDSTHRYPRRDRHPPDRLTF